MSAIVSTAQSRSGFTFRLMVAIIVTLSAPILLYFATRTAITGLKPQLAASLPPAEYSPLLRRLLPVMADPRLPVPAPFLSLAERAAAQEPLAYEPLFVLSRSAADRGDLNGAIRLMEAARRRRPNHILTRLLLMSYYGSSGRYPDALREMDYSLRSSESVRTVVVPELVKTMRTVQGRRALVDVLARQPEWRPAFIVALQNQEALNVGEARELLAMLQARQPAGDWSAERDLYIAALVRAGQASDARALWLQGFPKAERERYRTLYNGDFAGAPRQSPFAWTLRDETAGRAEISRLGAGAYLHVDYFGGQNVILAEQLLGLVPGTYQLAFNAKSDEGIKSGEFYWSVTCIPDGREVARVRLNAAQPAFRRFQAAFTVAPPGCSGQRLRLVAEAGDVATGYSAQISNMQLVRQ